MGNAELSAHDEQFIKSVRALPLAQKQILMLMMEWVKQAPHEIVQLDGEAAYRKFEAWKAQQEICFIDPDIRPLSDR